MLLLQLLLNGLVTAGIYSLLALGFGMVYRPLKFFYIAYGAIYTASAYFLFLAYSQWHVPLAPAIILAITLAVILGVAMDFLVYLPLERRGSTSGILFIASLGSYIVLVNIIALVFGNEVKVILEGLQPSFSLGPLLLTRLQLIQLLVGWGGATGLWFAIRKSVTIKALWAMGEAPDLLRVLGFSQKRLRIYAFAISSLMAALASVVVGLDVGVDPHVGMHAILTGAVAVLVGGIERYWAWVGGAFILAMSESLVIWKASARWEDAITFTILILTLLFRPQGLFSTKKRREEQ